MILEGGISKNYTQNWDKNGNIYYTDENGQVVDFKINPFTKLANKAKATAYNIGNWLNESNPNSEAYKQKVGLVAGLATAPLGIGELATAGVTRALAPYVGRKIAQNMATGLGSGVVGGGVGGGLEAGLNNENILTGGLKGSLLGGLSGLLGGYGLGKVGQKFERGLLQNNPIAQEQYFNDYIADLNNKTKVMADFRLAKIGGKKGFSDKLLDQVSYHGTPFNEPIEKFDLDFMGSGEGAQMYGAGIYTAKDKSVANKHYRFMGEDQEPIYYKGKPLLELYDNLERQASRLKPKEAQPFYDKMSLIEDLDYKGGLDDLDYFSPEIQNWYINEIEPNLTMPGGLYKVEIPDNDFLLHSELPLKEQPEKVQKALRDMFFDQGIDIDDVSNVYDMGALNKKPYSEVSGQTLYNIMNGIIGGNETNRKATSKLFNEYGIKGIRAFGDRDGEIFVTFDPQNAKIIESYYSNKSR